jgi:hypothetical protein
MSGEVLSVEVMSGEVLSWTERTEPHADKISPGHNLTRIKPHLINIYISKCMRFIFIYNVNTLSNIFNT